jgi:hypothetical protein
MSHTDKTDPYFVKDAFHGVEVHNHRNGICNLPPKGKPVHWSNKTQRRYADDCYWTLPWGYPWYGRCSCCWDYYERGRERKRAQNFGRRRHTWEDDYKGAFCWCHAGDTACWLCDNDYADLCSTCGDEDEYL